VGETSVLQVSLFRLRAEASAEGVVAAARELARLPSVLGAGFVRAGAGVASTHDMALFFLLPDRVALEEFGAGAVHVRFLRESVAPNVAAVVTAEVVASADRIPLFGAAAAWVADLPEATYDWQTAAELDAYRRAAAGTNGFLALLGGSAVERSRFGAAAVSLWRSADGLGSFYGGSAYREWAARWRSFAPALASVVGPGGAL